MNNVIFPPISGGSQSITTTEVDTKISNAIGTLTSTSPSTLDTLAEIATALGEDPNFATTMTTAIANKVSKAGDETIEGIKTFVTVPSVPNESLPIAKVMGLTNQLSTKATIIDVGQSLLTKANVTDLDLKADKSTTIAGYNITDAYTKAQVDSSLTNKANVTDLSAKANTIDVQSALDLKADITYVDNSIATKANTTDVGTALASKVDIATFNSAIASTGDMYKSIYDTTGNGLVDHAEVADTVTWSGVTNKPTTYAPTAHDHDDRYLTELELQPILDTKANNSVNIIAGSGLSGGGLISNDVNLSLSNSGVSAGVYGNTNNISQFTVDATGRITNAVNVPFSNFGMLTPNLFNSIKVNNRPSIVGDVSGDTLIPVTLGNKSIYAYPLVVGKVTNITGLKASITTAKSNSSMSIDIYSNTDVNGFNYPDVSLVSTTLDTTTTGDKVGLVSHTLVPNTVYWVVIYSSTNIVVRGIPVTGRSTEMGRLPITSSLVCYLTIVGTLSLKPSPMVSNLTESAGVTTPAVYILE